MKVFLSYAAEQQDIADDLRIVLQQDGHDVFYDKASLAAGKSYHDRLQSEIATSDVFVFLISPESVTPGRYTLSELEIAKHRWPNPSGHVLPVVAARTSLKKLDAYLKTGVHILTPKGNLAVEIAATLRKWSDPRLDRVYDLVVSQDFPSARENLEPILRENPSNSRANLYAAISALNGRSPRVMDSRTIRNVERYLNLAAMDAAMRPHALRVLAIVKYEHYVRNSLKESAPRFSEIMAELAQGEPPPVDQPLLSAVACSEPTRLLVNQSDPGTRR